MRRICVGTLIALSVAVAQTASDDEAGNAFLIWLRQAPPSDSPLVLIQAYGKQQETAQLPEAERNRQRDVVMRRMRTREDGWRVMFNNICATPGKGFNQNPNATLMGAIEGRTRGAALDPTQLPPAFQSFQILRQDDVMDKPDWIEQPSRVVRFVAEKSR